MDSERNKPEKLVIPSFDGESSSGRRGEVCKCEKGAM